MYIGNNPKKNEVKKKKDEVTPVYVLLLSVDKWHSIVMCSICFARCRVDSTTAIKLLTPYLNCLLVIVIYWRLITQY